MTAEFSKIIKLSEFGSAPMKNTACADAAQRAALAERFDLPDIESLTADYILKAEGERILFSGSLTSDLTQICAISGQNFPVRVTEEFNIAFVEKAHLSPGEAEIELAPEDCDLIEYEGAQIDIGEALAQTLYLALDPYPRGPEADRVAAEKGLKSEEEAGPFGALAQLKDKLG